MKTQWIALITCILISGSIGYFLGKQGAGHLENRGNTQISEKKGLSTDRRGENLLSIKDTSSLLNENQLIKEEVARLTEENKRLKSELKEALPDIVLPQTPKEVGTMIGKLQRKRYEMQLKYPDGAPAAGTPEFEAYVLEQDQLMRDFVPIRLTRQEFRNLNVSETSEMRAAQIVGALELPETMAQQMQVTIQQKYQAATTDEFNPSSRPEENVGKWYRQVRNLNKEIYKDLETSIPQDQKEAYEAMFINRQGWRWGR